MLLARETVLEALRTCRDPEIPINIVDLGLVYEIVTTDGPKGADVLVQMTLTSTGCPMSRSIVSEVQQRLVELPGVSSARVEIIWEPTWHPDMITEEGRRQLQLTP